jgi:hypothetical protein
MLVGAGYLAFYVISPTFTKRIMDQAAKQQAVQKEEREAKIAELKRQEEAAKTKEDKETLQIERENLEKNVEPDLGDLSEITGFTIFSDVRLTIFYFTEVIVAIVLNLLMLISGIGLLGLADWARKLAIGVSWAKIVRWLAMAIVTMVLVVPITTQKMQKFFDKLEQQTNAQAGRGATPFPLAASMAQFTAVSTAVTLVFEVIVCSIYPGLSIWYLTRPRVRAACMPKLPISPPEFGAGPGEPE